MVSGLLAPTDEEITYPQELRREIRRLAPGYRVHLSYHDPRYDDEELFLAELNQLFSDQVRVLRHLLAAPPRWDLGVAVISATDWLQHLMWKHMDDQHPLHDPEISPRLAAEVVRFWRRVDDLLDGLSHEPHTTLVVISDHGFGPHDQCLNLPRWLELKGYLRRRRRPALVEGKRALSGLARRFKALAPRGAAVAAKRALAARVTDEIDFGRSQAYVCGHTLPFGGIYLNIRGRDPQGILSPARAVEVKRRLLDELAGLGRELDQPLEVEAHEPPDIYRGEHTAEAPDIIFGVNDWRCVVEENRWAEDVFQNRPYTTRHTGSHRRRGIFLAAGPGIVRAGRVGPVGVCDVAPTVLSLLGLAPTPDMDGLARTEIMER
jgi:predicted AlkP superfamily phosphohydrolase/phosphomutase